MAAINLDRHPKTTALAEAMEWTIPETIGRLVMLWSRALEFYPDGIMSAAAIANAMDATKIPGKITDALLGAGKSTARAGFIEELPPELRGAGFYRIHDWERFSGRTTERAPRIKKSDVNSSRRGALREIREEQIREEKRNLSAADLKRIHEMTSRALGRTEK